MDNLWAPWRVKYITKIVKEKKSCVFCRIKQEKKDKKNYIIFRSDFSYAVLNLYPYNAGHSLVLPNKHVNDLSKLKKTEREDLMDVVEETKKLLDEVLAPAGYNIGMNLGRISGAGFPGHLHVHIVPRWKGDMNFMPVIAGTKVISDSLRDLYDRLTNAYKKRHRKN